MYWVSQRVILGFSKMLGKHPNELFGQPNIIFNHIQNFDTSKIQSYFFIEELLRLEMKEYSIKIFSITREYELCDLSVALEFRRFES